VQNGEAYRERSENNTLQKINIFTERGIIYDRNKVELAWNKKGEAENTPVPYTRAYLSPGFSHMLGYVSYPAKDTQGIYWQTEFIGKDGLEKQYQEKIKGVNGAKIIETDARGVIHSFNIINIPKAGDDLLTSIDSSIQTKLFNLQNKFFLTRRLEELYILLLEWLTRNAKEQTNQLCTGILSKT